MKKIALFLAALLIFSAVAFAADIELKAVESSFLSKAGYDPATKTLAIQMKNNSDTYLYKEVPQAVYDGLLAADSKGGYYVKNIKGKFATDRQ